MLKAKYALAEGYHIGWKRGVYTHRLTAGRMRKFQTERVKRLAVYVFAGITVEGIAADAVSFA